MASYEPPDPGGGFGTDFMFYMLSFRSKLPLKFDRNIFLTSTSASIWFWPLAHLVSTGAAGLSERPTWRSLMAPSRAKAARLVRSACAFPVMPRTRDALVLVFSRNTDYTSFWGVWIHGGRERRIAMAERAEFMPWDAGVLETLRRLPAMCFLESLSLLNFSHAAPPSSVEPAFSALQVGAPCNLDGLWDERRGGQWGEGKK